MIQDEKILTFSVSQLSPTDREVLGLVRTALLMLVDAVERKLEMPRTSEIRARLKELERKNIV